MNAHKPNIAVTGGGAVFIHNFEQSFDNFDVYSPSQTIQDNESTTAVGWNNKVPHIFASASESGTTTVWDLKHKKSVMTFSDANYNIDNSTY